MILPTPAPQERVEEPEQDSSGRKRRRIVQACETCRDRKRKCDGGRPVCGACARRPGHTCVWNDDRNTKGWSNSYVEGLRARIKELESTVTTSEGPFQAGSQSRQSASLGGDSPEAEFNFHDANGTANTEETESGPEPVGQLRHHQIMLSPPNTGGSPDKEHEQVAPRTHPGSVIDTLPLNRSRQVVERSHGYDLNDEAVSETCETEIDAMGVVQSTTDGDTGHAGRKSGYFGPSSTFSLLDDTYKAIHARRRGGSSHELGRRPSVRARETRARNEPGIGTLDLSLPPRVEADELMESYWTWVHSLYPFLHRPSFEKRYRSVWAGKPTQNGSGSEGTWGYYDDVGDGLFHCLLNLAFAMGAPFNDTLRFEQRDVVSRKFFSRAKALIDFDALASGSTALVQALLLMSQYLQSTDAASSCWNTVGMAVRVAQGIGLHYEPRCCWGETCEEGHGQIEVQMRRRTWTGAVLFDRVISLTYGRPLMIHPDLTCNRLFLPDAIDDEYLTGPEQRPGQQPPGIISLVECYTAAVRLQDIIAEFVITFNHMGRPASQVVRTGDRDSEYSAGGQGTSRPPTSSDLDIKPILEIEGTLVAWHASLVPCLQAQSYKNGYTQSLQQSAQRTVLLQRQANVLQARYLHARLALLRPALSQLCKMADQMNEKGREPVSFSPVSFSDNMNFSTLVKAAELCVSAARDLTEVIIDNVDPDFRRLPAPWYSVFYVHSGAMVLLLGYLCCSNPATYLDEATLMESFNGCLAFLKDHRPHSLSAQRCSRVLQLMQKQVLSYRNGSQEGSGLTSVDMQADILRSAGGVFHPVPPLGDLQVGESTFSQEYWGGDMSLNEFSPGMLDSNFDTMWLSHLTF